ncbi:MAG: parallel beta-helix domain-containing protein, partial [Bacteroidota bacterium]
MRLVPFSIVCIVLLGTMGCQPTGPADNTLNAENLEKSLLEALITAEDGDLINLPEGQFEFQRPLSLDGVPNVTIKGAGKGKTILSFKGQIEGAEGLIIKNSDNLLLEGFTLADTKGDALKVQKCDGVVIRDLETTWTGGALSTNGGYGLYPVNCKNVLMENCEASYASDAGIYVGQTTNFIVR